MHSKGRDANRALFLLPGRVKEGMDKNPLLVRATVGKARNTVYTLPAAEHVYGISIERDPLENAARVVNSWSVKETAKVSVPGLDYVTMNRNSTKKGIIKPKEIHTFRQANPIRVKVGGHVASIGQHALTVERRKGPLPSDSDPYFTYGNPTRPSTPVGHLMTDKYQREWLEKVQTTNKENAKKARLQKKHHQSFHSEKKNTKLSVLAKDPANLFRMSKFKKVPGKVNTHRTAESELAAAAAELCLVDKKEVAFVQ